MHHRQCRVRFANIRYNIPEHRLADTFALEPEGWSLSNPHSLRRRPAAQFNALLSAITGAPCGGPGQRRAGDSGKNVIH